jgi:RNA polymerase sigma-70 factor (ECF subfamily)
MLRRRGSPHDIASDAVSETFAVAWRRRHAVPQEEGAARAWLFTVAKQLMANLRRRHDRQLLLAHSVAAHSIVAAADATCQRLEATEAYESLSFADKDVLRLAASREPTMVELAGILRCSPTAAATRLWRARSRLERAMCADGSDHDARSLGGPRRRRTTGVDVDVTARISAGD